jgi:hypothetical protein
MTKSVSLAFLLACGYDICGYRPRVHRGGEGRKETTWALLFGGLNADAFAPSLEHAGGVASHGGYYTRNIMISLV